VSHRRRALGVKAHRKPCRGGSIYRAPVNRRVAIVLVASAVVLVVALANHFHPRSGSASGGSIGDWYALNGPQGNCARRYYQHTIQTHYDYDLVICRRAGRPYTCWERPVGLQTLQGGYHKVDLTHRQFDAECKTALEKLRSAGLHP
jgi:hypothetical protein